MCRRWLNRVLSEGVRAIQWNRSEVRPQACQVTATAVGWGWGFRAVTALGPQGWSQTVFSLSWCPHLPTTSLSTLAPVTRAMAEKSPCSQQNWTGAGLSFREKQQLHPTVQNNSKHQKISFKNPTYFRESVRLPNIGLWGWGKGIKSTTLQQSGFTLFIDLLKERANQEP